MAFDMEWQQIISINTFKGTFYTVLASRVDSKYDMKCCVFTVQSY